MKKLYVTLLTISCINALHGMETQTLSKKDLFNKFGRTHYLLSRIGRIKGDTRPQLPEAVINKITKLIKPNINNRELLEHNLFKPTAVISESKDTVASCTHNRLAVGTEDGCVKLYNLKKLNEPSINYKFHSKPIHSIKLDSNATQIATASTDGTVCLYSFDHYYEYFFSTGMRGKTEFAFSNNFFAYDREAQIIEIVHCQTGNHVTTLNAFSFAAFSYPSALAFSEDETVLALGRGNGEIDLYNIANHTLIKTLEYHKGPITRLKFKDPETLASRAIEGLSPQNRIERKAWNIATGIHKPTSPIFLKNKQLGEFRISYNRENLSYEIRTLHQVDEYKKNLTLEEATLVARFLRNEQLSTAQKRKLDSFNPETPQQSASMCSIQ